MLVMSLMMSLAEGCCSLSSIRYLLTSARNASLSMESMSCYLCSTAGYSSVNISTRRMLKLKMSIFVDCSAGEFASGAA